MQEDLSFKLEQIKRDLYGYIIPTKNEIEIMNMVSDSLENISISNDVKEMQMEKAIEEGIFSLRIFNKRYIDKVKNVVLMTYDDLDDNDLRTIIKFNMFSRFKKKGKPVEIKIPSKANIVTPIWIGHEYIHVLKDTNYSEFLLKDISSETLPMFYEMASTKLLFKDVHDIWKQLRLSFLSNNKEVYEALKENKNDEEKKILMYDYGQYLTSYYYALNLFYLYKKNPENITKMINKVLSHKITTLELLQKLDIYKIDKEHVNIYKLEQSKM